MSSTSAEVPSLLEGERPDVLAAAAPAATAAAATDDDPNTTTTRSNLTPPQPSSPSLSSSQRVLHEAAKELVQAVCDDVRSTLQSDALQQLETTIRDSNRNQLERLETLVRSNRESTDAKLDTLIDPKLFVGRAPEQVDEFLAEEVVPLLESNKALLEQKSVDAVNV